jgi:hypothetical protein
MAHTHSSKTTILEKIPKGILKRSCVVWNHRQSAVEGYSQPREVARRVE